jgi:hypothetical protein
VIEVTNSHPKVTVVTKEEELDVSKGKIMLELFLYPIWNCSCEIHHRRATVNKHKEIVCLLHNSICMHPELWCRKNSLLMHDNIPAHHSVLVQEELAKHQVTIFSNRPYSADFAPCNFFLIFHMKEKLHGHKFQSG